MREKCAESVEPGAACFAAPLCLSTKSSGAPSRASNRSLALRDARRGLTCPDGSLTLAAQEIPATRDLEHRVRPRDRPREGSPLALAGSGLMADIVRQGQLTLARLTKRYATTIAVDSIDLEVGRGEFLTLLGPSGSGKTTTLMMVAGFTPPSEGEILV